MLLTCTSIEGPLIAQLVPYRSYSRRYVLPILNIEFWFCISCPVVAGGIDNFRSFHIGAVQYMNG